MHFFVRRRVSRAALAVALICSAPGGALAEPPASVAAGGLVPSFGDAAPARLPPLMLAQAGRGLGVLAPALPMPVKPLGDIDITAELPPCQPAADSAPQSDANAGGAAPAGTSADAAWDCAVVPTAAQEAADTTAAGLDLNYIPLPPGSTQVKWGRPVGTPKPWFAGVSTEGGMLLGERNLTYRSVDGPSVSLGSLTPFSPAWSNAATIGGVQVSNLTAASDSTVPEGKLGYSSVWGRINNTDPGLTAGGVQYGAPAGSNSVRYGLTPDVTLEGQVQSARTLTTTGLGTTYSMGQWGTLQGGATQSHLDTAQGWRYSMGYNVSVFDSVKLGYSNELTSTGYGDLTSYQDGATTTRQWRDTFSAGLPISGWGEVNGTYSGLRDDTGEMLERRYGISQSMMLSPNVRLAVGADHDVITGDYGVNMQLTMPIGGR